MKGSWRSKLDYVDMSSRRCEMRVVCSGREEESRAGGGEQRVGYTTLTPLPSWGSKEHGFAWLPVVLLASGEIVP